MAGQLVRGHVHARQLRHILGNSLFLAIFGENDTNEDQFEQAAQKVEPHLHDARERLVEASQPRRHESD